MNKNCISSFIYIVNDHAVPLRRCGPLQVMLGRLFIPCLHFVSPDLGPNCLQRLTADDTSRQRVKILLSFWVTVKVASHDCIIKTGIPGGSLGGNFCMGVSTRAV